MKDEAILDKKDQVIERHYKRLKSMILSLVHRPLWMSITLVQRETRIDSRRLRKRNAHAPLGSVKIVDGPLWRKSSIKTN